MGDGQRAAVLSASTPWRHIVRRQMPSCRPAPTVCVGTCCTARSCLALRSPTRSYSKEYGHGPKITTDWQDHYRLANAIGYCEAVGRVYAGLITALTTQEVPALQAGAFWPANHLENAVIA